MENNLDKLGGRIVLYHDSDPVLYDETGQWTFDEHTTIQEDNGENENESRIGSPTWSNATVDKQHTIPRRLMHTSFLRLRGQVRCSTTIVHLEDTTGANRMRTGLVSR